MKAVGYVRVSTEKQADHGISLEAQTDKIRAMATVQGIELAEIIVDAGESAKTLKRPGMVRLLKMIDAGEVSKVFVAKLDRLTRSVRDIGVLLERFEKKEVSLVSVAEMLDTRSAAGRLTLNIMVSVSQWEREAIGERTRDALAHKRANGNRTGNIPFGFTLGADGKLVPNAAEQVVVAKVRELRQMGFTLRQIADELNAQGFKTRKGGEWRHQYVATMAA